MGIEARIDVQGFDLDVRHAGQLFGFAHDQFGTFAHLFQELIQVVRRQVTHFEIQGAQVRHDVQRLAADNLPDMHGAVGHVVFGILSALPLQLLLALTQRGDEVASHVNRIDRTRCQGGMGFQAATVRTVRALALVPKYELHVGRLTDHAQKRPHRRQMQYIQ
ncbi:hypothetical protein D3C75_574990 [compost metagenome]